MEAHESGKCLLFGFTWQIPPGGVCRSAHASILSPQNIPLNKKGLILATVKNFSKNKKGDSYEFKNDI